MKKSQIITSTLIVVLIAVIAGAQQPPTPKQIYQNSIDVTRVNDVYSRSVLIIISKRGEKRVRKMKVMSKLYNRGSLEKKMIRFTAPADVKGTGFLTFDYNSKSDDKWIYMPALRKTRRIISSENAKSFMGSEFSYADMSFPNVNDFNYRRLPDESVNGQDCYVLEIKPINRDIEDENGFSKKISYIAKNNSTLRRAVYYDLSGEKEKIMEVESVIEVDKIHHKYKLKKIVITNLQNGRKSVSEILYIKNDPSLSGSFFTTHFLEKQF